MVNFVIDVDISDLEIEDPSCDLESTYCIKESIQSALKSLRLPDRQVVMLLSYGATHKELMCFFDIGYDAICKRIERAKSRFKEALMIHNIETE